ncbi:hypothetical protein H6G94_28550 [Nostoc punctiforme FACHB-252]|jgi:hypothetical protein|uniref:Uncharacterized protein n=1 Tax=Nostoc punctiforme FACHB-252 TaxID=1357509 RepID=A0ABR8HIQ2_NOSPU|nr:hypothetical protein [Nostoc punctiforme]MBD2615156.1 hypothetical protein [Nostoc punctiforme FACHB-252]MDZ8015781.1 hypothetical protein [Nostoc sp. ZfuVER08]
MNSSILETTMNLETCDIQKAVKILGLEISDGELDELKSGNNISLTSRDLSEIGSVFILAEAILRTKVIKVKNVTFDDLEKVTEDFSQHSGIPIYCWDSETSGKCCLLLTLVDGKPNIRLSKGRSN